MTADVYFTPQAALGDVEYWPSLIPVQSVAPAASSRVWVDTSNSPPILKGWNGTDWVAIGGGGAGLTTEDVDDRVAALITAGANVTKSYDDVANTLTLAAATDAEVVRDTMAAALVAGTNVTITPDDTANTITITATGSGAATVATAVQRSTDFAITAGTVTEIPWNAEITDTSGFHDLTTNTGRLTVPTGQGGTYEMQAHITLKNDSGNARRMLALGKNGTVVVESGIKGWGDATASPSIDMVYTLTLAAADYLTLSVWSETAGTNLYGGRCTWSLRKVA